MSHPLNPDSELLLLRDAAQRWEQAEPGTERSELLAETMVNGFNALDRHLCNGGALPGDWQAVDLHNPAILPQTTAEPPTD